MNDKIGLSEAWLIEELERKLHAVSQWNWNNGSDDKDSQWIDIKVYNSDPVYSGLKVKAMQFMRYYYHAVNYIMYNIVITCSIVNN